MSEVGKNAQRPSGAWSKAVPPMRLQWVNNPVEEEGGICLLAWSWWLLPLSFDSSVFF